MIPVLMITCGRLAYTIEALNALVKSDCGDIFIYDNGSKDNTPGFLSLFILDYKKQERNREVTVFLDTENKGIAHAMNWFLEQTKESRFVCKVDNDTVIPTDFCARMLRHMPFTDLLQAKHPIIKATNPNGWDGFTKNMKRQNELLYNSFIGGSGIMFSRSSVNKIPETQWLIGGWRQYQKEHPELRKAFAPDVEIELLDSEDRGGYPEEYKEYYKETGRIC